LVVPTLGDEVDDGRRVDRVEDRLLRATRVDEYLDRDRTTRPVLTARETLRDDPAQRLRERGADLLLLVRGEEVDDAVDRLLRIDRVQRRQHEVPRLGRGERRTDRLDVTHLAHED